MPTLPTWEGRLNINIRAVYNRKNTMNTEKQTRAAYKTEATYPNQPIGENSHGAITQGEWMIKECRRMRRRGGDSVVVRLPDGRHAIALASGVLEGDQVLGERETGGVE